MKILGKLLGSDKVISGGIDAIDKAFLTKEEIADNWIRLLKAYEPFKIAQRLLALIISTVFLLVWLMAAIMMVTSYWYEGMFELAISIADYNIKTLGTALTLIVGFYFASGAAEGIISKIKSKQ